MVPQITSLPELELYTALWSFSGLQREDPGLQESCRAAKPAKCISETQTALRVRIPEFPVCMLVQIQHGSWENREVCSDGRQLQEGHRGYFGAAARYFILEVLAQLPKG